MKKTAVVVVLAMIIGLCSTSCSRKGEQDVSVSKIAIDYLAMRNVVSSKVKKADFTFFSEYNAIVEPIDYWSVSERLESATASFCDLKYSERAGRNRGCRNGQSICGRHAGAGDFRREEMRGCCRRGIV